MRKETYYVGAYSRLYGQINLNESSVVPIYMQIANCITDAINSEVIGNLEWLPSINDLSAAIDVARDTVQKAYNFLKQCGTIGAYAGKGFYAIRSNSGQKFKLFLLLNKLSVPKKMMYDALMQSLDSSAHIDVCIYNNDYGLFKKFIQQAKSENYSRYLITPHLSANEKEVAEVLDQLPKEKLIVLDKRVSGIAGNYASVCEDFEKDIYFALIKAQADLRRYKKLKLLFPCNSDYPQEIISGFQRFCKHFDFKYKMVSNAQFEPVEIGDVFLTVTEDDLVVLVERIIDLQLKTGTDVGLLSYNETSMKRVLLNGIATISTDFAFIGAQAAELVKRNTSTHIDVPFSYIKRASL